MAPTLTGAGDLGSGGGFRINENLGLLGVFTATSDAYSMETSLGKSDAVDFDVLVVNPGLNGNYQVGEKASGTVFNIAVRSQLLRARRQDQAVIGVIGLGEAAKGKSAPWILADPTPEQRKAAEAIWAKSEAPF